MKYTRDMCATDVTLLFPVPFFQVREYECVLSFALVCRCQDDTSDHLKMECGSVCVSQHSFTFYISLCLFHSSRINMYVISLKITRNYEIFRQICSNGMSGVPLFFCLRRCVGLSCGIFLPDRFGRYCSMRLCASSSNSCSNGVAGPYSKQVGFC